jgi:methylmalonyl-CoA decarboxylase
MPLTFNHPEKHHCLSQGLIADLIDGLDRFRDEAVRVAILRAPRGAKVWSAGHDVTELPRPGREPLAYNDPLERGIRAVREFQAPVIALLEGAVYGGACDLALSCDILVGAPSTSFSLTPAKLGVPYNPAGILRLLTAIGSSLLVREMFFTAAPVTAERALRLGLLNHVVAEEALEGFVQAMAERINELSPLSVSVAKEQIRLLCDARPINPETFERIQGLRRTVYDSLDYQEGISAFLEKRKPSYQGK